MKKGSHHTSEAIVKMRTSWTPEKRTKQAISAANAMRGPNNPMRRPEVQKRHLVAVQRPEVRAKYSGDNSPTKRPEVRAKIAVAMRGEGNPMKRPEVRAKHLAAMQSPEVKTKHLAATPRGDNHPMKRPEQRARVSGDNNPMKRSEVVAKVAAAQRGQKRPNTTGDKSPTKRPEVRSKLSAAWTPERRAKWAIIMRGDTHPMKRPEVAAKVAAAKLGKKRPNMRAGKNPAWLGGISREPYAWEFSDELKEAIRKRDGHQCQLCGASQVEFKARLPVHHIDYDKKNSDPVNLTALCIACNSRVNTNREHWTAFFQEMMIRRANENPVYWEAMRPTAS